MIRNAQDLAISTLEKLYLIAYVKLEMTFILSPIDPLEWFILKNLFKGFFFRA